MTFEQITIHPEGGRPRTGWFKIGADLGRFLLLVPVNAEGDDRSRIQKDGTVVEVMELVEKALVARRQPAVMDNHYGTLRVAEDPEDGIGMPALSTMEELEAWEASQ